MAHRSINAGLQDDRGFQKGVAIKNCYDADIKVLVPKTLTSGNRAAGRFEKEDFQYEVEADHYRCPAGEILQRRFSTVEKSMAMQVYFSSVSVCRKHQDHVADVAIDGRDSSE